MIHAQKRRRINQVNQKSLFFLVAAIGDVAVLHVLRLPILHPEVLFQLPGGR